MEADLNDNPNILDKSFCYENKIDKDDMINLINSENENIDDKKFDDMSLDDDFSGNLIPSLHLNHKIFAELNFSNPSSNELNIFDSVELNKNKTLFFRKVTGSQCEVSPCEEKAIKDKIILHYKSSSIKQNDEFNNENEEDRVYSNTVSRNIGHFNYNHQYNINNVNLNVNINNKTDSINNLGFSESEFDNIFNIKNENLKDYRIFRKNKCIHSSLQPTDFNVLVVGGRGTGKSTFIKRFIEKLQNAVSHQKKLDPNSYALIDIDESSINLLNSEVKRTSNFKRAKICVDYYSHGKVKEIYKMSLIDSPGYAENDYKWAKDVVNYIETKNEEYYNLKEEAEGDETLTKDCRIHLCLYFTNEATSFDFSTMSLIGNITNLIPVIGRKEPVNKDEVINIKAGIVEKGRKSNVNYFEIDKALSKICHDARKSNTLLGGFNGFCPPFLIYNCAEANSQDDFSRLYYIVACFIPFECIRITKVLYKKFKNKKKTEKIKKELKDADSNCNNKQIFNCITFGLSILSAIYFLKKDKK